MGWKTFKKKLPPSMPWRHSIWRPISSNLFTTAGGDYEYLQTSLQYFPVPHSIVDNPSRFLTRLKILSSSSLKLWQSFQVPRSN
jgi:hypothetical protein